MRPMYHPKLPLLYLVFLKWTHIWRISSLLLTAFPGCERGLHGFSLRRQRVFADVHLQPQRQLLSTLRSGGRWEKRLHLAMDCRAGNNWQHSGGGCGLCLCLLTDSTSWFENLFFFFFFSKLWNSLTFGFLILHGILHIVVGDFLLPYKLDSCRKFFSHHMKKHLSRCSMLNILEIKIMIGYG